jgi:hypothetical protein
VPSTPASPPTRRVPRSLPTRARAGHIIDETVGRSRGVVAHPDGVLARVIRGWGGTYDARSTTTYPRIPWPRSRCSPPARRARHGVTWARATTPQACFLRGVPLVVRPPPRQPRPCHLEHLPGQGMNPTTPDGSGLVTGRQPSQVRGPRDMEGKARPPDRPRRATRRSPGLSPCDTGCAAAPRRPPPSNPRDGIPPRATSSDRLEACAILTLCSPTPPVRPSRKTEPWLGCRAASRVVTGRYRRAPRAPGLT